MTITSHPRTLIVTTLSVLSLTFASADAARKAEGLPGSEVNFSRWAGLDPADNARRARLAELEAALEALERNGRGSEVARREALSGAREVRRTLEALAEAPWSRRAALQARVAAGLFLLEARVEALKPAPAHARIAGPVRFPGCEPPADLMVCAEPLVETGNLYCTKPSASEGELRYVLDVPPGEYLVFAHSAALEPGFRAYYSRAVTCGLRVECRDHRPLVVALEPGQVASGVAPADWFRAAQAPLVTADARASIFR